MSKRLRERAIQGVADQIAKQTCPFCLDKSLDIGLQCRICKAILGQSEEFQRAVDFYTKNLQQILLRAEIHGSEIPHSLLPSRQEAWEKMLNISRRLLYSSMDEILKPEVAEQLQDAVRTAERAVKLPLEKDKEWLNGRGRPSNSGRV